MVGTVSPMVSSRVTLLALLDLYSASRLNLSQATADQYLYACRSLAAFCPVSPLAADLSADLIIPWLKHRLTEVSARSVKRERQAILTLWRWAYRNGYNRNNPSEADIPPVRVPQRPTIAWTTPEEIDRIVAVAKSLPGEMRGTGIASRYWWSSLLVWLYWTGARIGALLAVRPGDINFSRRLLHLRAECAKTGIGQWRPLHDQAIAAVMTHFDPTRELVRPYPYNPRQKYLQLKSILHRAGLPADRYHSFHCFRRTTATQAARNGGIEVDPLCQLGQLVLGKVLGSVLGGS